MLAFALAATALAQDKQDPPKQDPPRPDAKALVARIDGKNPEACFDAIARLVDLADSARADVEAAAAAMPEDLAFYRAALLDELKLRGTLGDKYPREARVTIDAKERVPSDILRDILSQSKEQIDSAWAFQGGGAQSPLTMKFDDVPCLSALRTLCKEAHLRIYSQGGALTLYRSGGEGGPSFQFRTQLVTVDSIQRARRVTFGAGERKSFNLQASVICESRANAVGIGKATIAEATDDKGRRLEALPEEKPDGMPDDGSEYASNANTTFNLSLTFAPPEKGVEKVARVRGSVPIQMPRTTNRFVFPADKLEKQSDEHYEVSVETSQTVHRQIHATVRVKPKGAMKAFLETPLQIRMKAKDGAERPCYASGKVVGDAVEYTAQRYQSAEEQMQGKVPELESVTILIHRETVERKMWFEFRDIPVE